MKIKFQDLKIRNENLRFDLIKDLKSSFDDGQYINGDAVDSLENEFKNKFQVNDAIFTSSGTSSLLLALKDIGVTFGDEVIVPAMSWVATAHVVTELGAEAVFCDVLSNLTLDPNSFKKLISSKTKAVIPVHFGGISCEMDEIVKIAKEFGVKIVEDCSQAFGNKFKNYFLGTIGDYGCFSMNPMKTMGALGEAGMVITNSENNIRENLYSGVDINKVVTSVGLNFRGDNLQARFLKTILKYQDDKTSRLHEIWSLYEKNLAPEVILVGRKECFIPYCVSIISDKRDEIEKELLIKGIETKRLHVPIMPDMSPYINCKRDTNNIDQIKNKICTLPLHQYLSEDDVLEICEIINRVVK